jgi:hypothetical protein
MTEAEIEIERIRSELGIKVKKKDFEEVVSKFRKKYDEAYPNNDEFFITLLDKALLLPSFNALDLFGITISRKDIMETACSMCESGLWEGNPAHLFKILVQSEVILLA